MSYNTDYSELAFNNWFHNNYGSFSFRSEAFFADCLVGDEKTRQEILYKWLVSAYMAGYNEAGNESFN